MDDSYAIVTEETAEIFGQVFSLVPPPGPLQYLDKPLYYATGELESFKIPDTVINFMGLYIPIGYKIFLYKSGRFKGSVIHLGLHYKLTGQREYVFEHKGHTFCIGGGFSFYESGNIKKISIIQPSKGPKKISKKENPFIMETKFPLEDKILILRYGDTIEFYDESGLPKIVYMKGSRNATFWNYRPPDVNNGKDYNVFEMSETGKIISTIMEPRPDFDYD